MVELEDVGRIRKWGEDLKRNRHGVALSDVQREREAHGIEKKNRGANMDTGRSKAEGEDKIKLTEKRERGA